MSLIRAVRQAARRRISKGLGALVLAFVLSGSAVLAGSEHHGQVSFTGLPVPGATVTASSTTPGAKTYTAITDDRGVYTFPDLPDGQWTIKVEMLGFAPIQQDVSVAKDGAADSFDLKMLAINEIAGTTAAPVVKVETAPTATASNSSKNSKNQPAKPAAPAFQRANLNAAAGTAPAEPAPAGDSSAATAASADASQKAADGILVNGSSNNGAASPFAQSAAFGNNRRGGRSLYSGGFSLIMDNSALDARPYSLSGQDTARPNYNNLTGGFTFGGPLKIPHLIAPPNVFIGYQRADNRTANTASGLVPTDAERRGDLSSFAGQIIDPLTGQPFAGNQIPTQRISPQAQALLSYYPEANFITGSHYNYQIANPSINHTDSAQTRWNKQIGNKNSLNGGVNFQRIAGSSENLFNFLDTSYQLGWNTNIVWTHRPSPRVAHTFSYTFSRLHSESTPYFANRINVSGAAGITGNNQDAVNWGPPALTFSSGFNGLNDGNESVRNNQTSAFSYNGLWSHSPHSFQYGGDFRRQQFNTIAQANARGQFGFNGTATGYDFADFLLGVPDTSAIAFGNADKYLRQSVYDAFINDDWRVRSGLTLNVGIRWDYETPVTEKYGRLVNLDLASGFTAAAPVIAGSPTGTITGVHYPNTLVQPDRNGIQPRVALAWRPLAASSLIVRASYGVYRNTSVYQAIANQMAQQAPLSKSLSVSNSPANPLTLANGFNITPGATPTTFAVDPNFRVGYAQTWSASVQRDLPAALAMTATYTGTKGTRLMQESLPNTYPTGAVNPCPACPYGFAYLQSNGNSTRQAGQFQLRRRLRNGLTASAQYTYAKAIDNAGFSTPNQLIAQNWRNLDGERGLSTFDQRHQLVVQGQYTTGMGLAGGALMSGWRGTAFKEWTFVDQFTFGSGSPFTPIYPGTVPGTSYAILRPNVTGAPVYTNSGGVFLNSAAFIAPAAGQFGNAARDSLIGPRQFSMNGSLARTFRLSDRLNADLRFDASNILNHATYTAWGNIIGNAQFGVPVSVSQPRIVQTTFRVRF